jgi:aspartyl-tRNA(Asn)/glutamyl-tRNA(Gln) amidotransferase subunit A
MLRSVRLLAADLAQGKTSSRELTEACLDRIGREGGEGPRAFTRTYAESARAAADAADRMRAAGVVLSPIAGLPVSVKDLFDVAGEPTLAGSTVLRGAPAAAADAEVVARLRRAGAVVVGKTNMTEFAFSGLGMNPHHGSPRAPWDRAVGRISGGSSSGAAVSVTDEMAAFAIGTDTGGSVRIPAAFCGLVGFKPTARRVSLAGAYPLSRSLDSIGPIATTVACCATIDRVLSGDGDGEYRGNDEGRAAIEPLPIAGLRLGVPCQYVLDDLDPEVARAFAAALSALSTAGARVVDLDVPELLELPDINKGGGFAVLEAYAVHRKLIAERESAYDPRVASRILRGKTASAADYVDLVDRRVAFRRSVERAATPFDALVFPAAALVPPRLADLEASDDAYYRANARALRNTTVINFLDGCALSIPCHEPGTAPVGLMVAGAAGSDRRILAAGLAIESALSARFLSPV